MHTPGPWRRCGGFTPAYCAIHSNDGYIVFGMADPLVHTERGQPIKAPDTDTQHANARLIAKAPAMLDVLRRVADFWAGGDVPEDLDRDIRALLED